MCVFFFKQKTAYEMRISDWSSDVCSSDLVETGCVHQGAPGVQVVIGAVTATVPAFLIVAARIRAEQRAAGTQGGMQLRQHARQFLGRHMEQHRVGKNAVKATGG